jgi:hypothetical protein
MINYIPCKLYASNASTNQLNGAKERNVLIRKHMWSKLCNLIKEKCHWYGNIF